MNRNRIKVTRIVSGGQTGVDRAALDVAIESGIEHGGWCPLGRRAEDGMIAARYLLKETESADYSVRTKANVIDSDATLILGHGEPTGGTELTCRLAGQAGKPLLIAQLSHDLLPATQPAAVRDWLAQESVDTLNVAGPRESTSPGVYAEACEFLEQIFRKAD